MAMAIASPLSFTLDWGFFPFQIPFSLFSSFSSSSSNMIDADIHMKKEEGGETAADGEE